MTKKDSGHWWREHFEESPAHRSVSQVQAQIDGVEKLLNLEPRSRVLDIGCGSGGRTLELARRVQRVLGIDSLEASLWQARQAAREDRLSVHFVKSDIRQLAYRDEFDAVVNFGTAFGRFTSDRDDLRMLESVRKSLKSEGKFLIDLLNKEWLMRHFEPNFGEQGRQEKRGSVVLEQITYNLEAGRLENRRTFIGKDGSRVVTFVSLRVYTLTEIKSLIERAGLVYRQVWGGFDGSAYGMDSARMIVLAVKPHEARAPRKADENLVRAIRIKGRRK